jgi:peptidoglycan/xylan/chitin deacetylase (PgdA/CDA1 family)
MPQLKVRPRARWLFASTLFAAALAGPGCSDVEHASGHNGHEGHNHVFHPHPEYETVSQAATTYPLIGMETKPSYIANNVLGLSFDDGPDAVNTPKVLDVLKAKGVKATFFINTHKPESFVNDSATLKAIIKRIVDEGHQLGSHTARHLSLPSLSTTQIETEITDVQTTVNRSDVLGANWPKLTMLRAPFGDGYYSNPPDAKVAPIVGKYAVHFGWAVDTLDWDCDEGTATQREDCVYNNFVSLVKTPGTGAYGQVLMHSIQPQTAAAIGRVIDYAKSKGFVFKQGEDFVVAKYGKTSQELIYGTPPPPPPPCNQTPFGGTARAIPGTIQIEDFDSGGLNCAYFDSTTGNAGNQYRTSDSVDIQVTSDSGGGYNVGWVIAGEWLEYTVNVATAGNYKLELRAATTATGKSVDVFMDSTLIADNLAIANTGAYQTFATNTKASVTLPAGTHVLKLLFNSPSVNFNWIKFTALATCTPESDTTFCSRLGKNCGVVSQTDNCGVGRAVDCGTCTLPATCGGAGTANVCGVPCQPESDAQFCARLGKNCGTVSGSDNCSSARTVASCGTCSAPATCGGGGTPNVCEEPCIPESDALFCERLGKTCGTVTGTDNCNTNRTVPSCGTCTAPETCSASNVCVACVPETDAQFCARLGKSCGSFAGTDNCGTSRSVASCGSCASPATCGGGGTPNVCGTSICGTPFGGTARTIPGTIQAEDFDNGGQNCAYNDTTTGNSGAKYRTTENVDIQVTTDTGGGHNIGWVIAGEWLTYTVNIPTAGNYKLEYRGSATATGKTVDIFLDSTLIADNLAIANTGNYQTFATAAKASVALPAGTHQLKVLFNASSQNFNWIKFTKL